ncbi:MAG: hypothetical protein ABFD54_12325 [Armatimonadota bacterium]|nr:hypothetical protein [bacterium]
MKKIGLGLHAVQDIFAHMDLTPPEHLDRDNANYVDDIIMEREAEEYGISGRSLWCTTKGYSAPGCQALKALYITTPAVRVFHWYAGAGLSSLNSRIGKTASTTITELQSFLELMSANYLWKKCTKCVSAKITP